MKPMGKSIRVFLAIVTVLSVVLLARDPAARAADPADRASSSSAAQAEPSGWLHEDDGKDDPCEKANNRDKDKDKEKCKDEDEDDGGSVKPPKKRIKACQVGSYSVGGSVTLEVKKLKKGHCVMASVQPVFPGFKPEPPEGTRFLSDVLDLKLPKKDSLVEFCFAAPPGTQPQIYIQSRGEWRPAGGSIGGGTICMEVSRSGTFVVIGNQ
jgi:hypothetical protein